MLVALLVVACRAPDPGPGLLIGSSGSTAAEIVESRPLGWGSLDTGSATITYDERTDVVVVGSGPAGLAAALAAREAGASVLLLERSETAASGVMQGSILFAAGTAEQTTAGVEDSPAQAALEWPVVTGVPGDLPSVATFLEGSAENLAWLQGLGVVVQGLSVDHDGGGRARMHVLQGDHTREVLLAAYDGELRTSAEVTAPILEDGRVTGVIWRDTDTGAVGTIGAGAVVIATGGFLRDRDAVNAARPALASRDLLYETSPSSTGGGLPFLDAVGAGAQNLDQIGLYVHSLQDPEHAEGESLRLGGSGNLLLVGEDGRRFVNEELFFSLDLFEELPEGEVHAVFPDVYAAEFAAARPGYFWATAGVEEEYTLAELAAVSDEVAVSDSLAGLAATAGLDADGLASTLEQVNEAIASGHVDPFGRDFSDFEPLEDGRWWAVHITPGLAKAFGGVATDGETHVLDTDGAVIPGLYAAGEVAGMIPEGGAGSGFAGSVSACYLFGRIAGINAAEQ